MEEMENIKIKNIPKLSNEIIEKWVKVCKDDFDGCCVFCYPLLEEAKKRNLI